MTAVATARTAARAGGPRTGTLAMIRFVVRRDRVRLAVWTGSVVAFAAYFTFALDTLFADPAAQQGRAAIMSTPAGIVLGGPGYGLDHYTTGVALANEGILWLTGALAIMSILHMVRHTRAEEETGRAELMRAAVVGRYAPALAAAITLAAAHAAIAVLSALTMIGIGGLPAEDAFAMGVGCGLGGMVFGAVALVAAQIVDHGRAATGIAMGAFGVAFVVRAAGDLREVGGSWLSWLSPLAWAQQARAFVDLRWWPLALSVFSIAALLWAASALAARRDFGGGLVKDRPGRDDARPGLRSPLAMAWRQERPTLAWTALGLGLMWFATGTMMPTLDDMVADVAAENPVAGDIFGGDPSQLSEGFLAVMVVFAALCVAAYAIVVAQHARSEESAGRAEAALTAPVSRGRWLAARAVVAGGGTALLMALSLYAMWAGAVIAGWDAQSFAEYTAVLGQQLPVLAVYLGLCIALYGVAPRVWGLVWALFAYGFVAGMFGAVLDLPDWAMNLSPLAWAPTAFSGEGSVPGSVLAWACAVVLGIIGFVGFRRRDLVSG